MFDNHDGTTGNQGGLILMRELVRQHFGVFEEVTLFEMAFPRLIPLLVVVTTFLRLHSETYFLYQLSQLHFKINAS